MGIIHPEGNFKHSSNRNLWIEGSKEGWRRKKNESTVGLFKMRRKKNWRNFHESFNINYSSSNVNSIASYKVQRTKFCVVGAKMKKRFQRQIFASLGCNTAQAVLFNYRFHRLRPFLKLELWSPRCGCSEM